MQVSQSSIQVVGVIRFSVLAQGFAVSLYGGMDNLREYLFSGPSLEFRFHIFETLCLPSLLRQTDPDFHVVLLTSTELPQAARQRLDAIVAPHPNIHVYAADLGKHHVLVRDAYNSIPTDGYSHRAAFRLDNDDALCTTFVQRIRALSSGLLALHDADQPTIIAFNRGFYVQLNPDAPNEVYDTIEREPLSTGTTLLTRVGHMHNPYRFNHRAVAQHFNTYTDISFPGFLRTIHGENDDRVMQRGIQRQLPPRRIRRQVTEHFGIRFDMLQDLKCP